MIALNQSRSAMMPFSDSTPPTRILVSVLRRAWQRYLTVYTDDPVRKTKNQGILLIIAGLCAMAPVGTIYGDSVFIQILSLALGLLTAACAIPTRRGSTVGAWMLVILLTI